ncbi:protein of unknown function [Aminobacter niigataensis]|nr:protein of unknown function [Aminobacter niigataensis]
MLTEQAHPFLTRIGSPPPKHGSMKNWAVANDRPFSVADSLRSIATIKAADLVLLGSAL